MADRDNEGGIGRNRTASVLQAVTGPWTWRNLLSWLGIVLLILFIKGCVIDQYTIPSGSMEPTLKGDPRFFRGDRVLVNKWLFGPRVPFTARRLWQWGAPSRWDIVVLRSVQPDAQHPILIKRIVGLPGETVHIQDGQLWVDGTPIVPPEHLREILHYTTELQLSDLEKRQQFLRLAQVNEPLALLNAQHPPVQQLYAEMARVHPAVRDLDVAGLAAPEIEVLCEGLDRAALNLIKNLYVFTQPPMPYGISDEPSFAQVPENHYFVLGDNSAQSIDGRMYGWVPHSNLMGRAFAVWWPWAHRCDFTGFSKTWWGAALLYGIPLGVVLLELALMWRERRRRSAP